MSHGIQPKTVSCIKPPKQTSMCFYGSCVANKVLGDSNFKVDKKWKIALANPSAVVATDDQGKKHKGTWTSVYDEGFEVHVAGRTFFAFSKFNNGQSECKQTWPGWHRDSKNPDAASWGCYTGQKKSEKIEDEDLALLTMSERTAHEQLEEQSLIEIEEVQPMEKNQEFASVKDESPQFQTDPAQIMRINAKASTWKAKVYPEYKHMTISQFNQRAGYRFRKGGVKSLRHRSTELVEVDVSDLPETFDWRNKDGQNYVDPVVDQACGSCYAVASVSMLNSRIRIKTKNRVKPQLPYGQVLSCDHYDQGCAGGYPFLVQKYSMEYGLTKSGKCAKSTEELRELGEGKDSSQDAYIRAVDYKHIGGFQGAATTTEMMRELYDHGPLVIGLNGGYELMHYDSGVFIETGAGPTASLGEGNGGKKGYNYFEATDHAALLVGWGKDKKSGKKHWIVKNSYGSGWGEGGYFRIPLGGDVDGITSISTAATPVLGDSGYFNEHGKSGKKSSRM